MNVVFPTGKSVFGLPFLLMGEGSERKYSFNKILKHTGPLVRCRDTTDNLSVDERSHECDVRVDKNGTVCLGMSCSNQGFCTR